LNEENPVTKQIRKRRGTPDLKVWKEKERKSLLIKESKCAS